MRFILICLAAVLLSGCGYIAGKRIDIGSDFDNSDNKRIQKLAGTTFYIKNNDDYERLIQLKNDLRKYSHSQTPTELLEQKCEREILKITNQYDSGIFGFLYWTKMTHNLDPEFADYFTFVFFLPLLVIAGLVFLIEETAKWIKGLFMQSK
jgi:hypothetical protein